MPSYHWMNSWESHDPLNINQFPQESHLLLESTMWQYVQLEFILVGPANNENNLTFPKMKSCHLSNNECSCWIWVMAATQKNCAEWADFRCCQTLFIVREFEIHRKLCTRESSRISKHVLYISDVVGCFTQSEDIGPCYDVDITSGCCVGFSAVHSSKNRISIMCCFP